MGLPIIPIGPGVPTLSPLTAIAATAVDLILSDVISIVGDTSPQWGLFLNGDPVVTAESVISFDYKQNYSISKFAIEPSSSTEPAALASYNKVQQPFEVRLQFATGDTPAARQQLLNSVDAACASLELMTAVTPEKSYQNLNPISSSYRRTAFRGQALIVVDEMCEQVRTTASSTFTNAQQTTSASGTANNDTVTPASNTFDSLYSARITQPGVTTASAAPTVNNGTVQTTPAQQSATDGVIAQSMLPF